MALWFSAAELQDAGVLMRRKPWRDTAAKLGFAERRHRSRLSFTANPDDRHIRWSSAKIFTTCAAGERSFAA